MADIQPWGGRRAQTVTAEFRAECEAADARCWLCQQPIDYVAERPAPDAFELDHFYPRSEFPELTWEPSNFRASHASCNQARGKRDHPAALGPTTIDW